MPDLSQILKDEAWLEGERRKEAVPLSDVAVFEKSVEIWNKENEKNKVNPPIEDELC